MISCLTELSRSNDSSDSSENLFGDGEFHLPEIKRTSQGSRGAVIIPPVSVRSLLSRVCVRACVHVCVRECVLRV